MSENNNKGMIESAEPQKRSKIPQKTNKMSENGEKRAVKRPVRASELHPVRSIQVVNIKKSDKKPFPWAVVFSALILTAMFLFMMMNYAEVDKYRSEIADLGNQIGAMEKTQKSLQITLNGKYDNTAIADYAQNTLGMVQKEKLSSYRVTVEQDDRIEMNGGEETKEEGGIGFLLSGLAEVWRDFFNRN